MHRVHSRAWASRPRAFVAHGGEVVRILVTSSTFPLAQLDGSHPRFVYDLAEALAEHAEVHALAPHEPGAPRAEQMGRVQVQAAMA